MAVMVRTRKDSRNIDSHVTVDIKMTGTPEMFGIGCSKIYFTNTIGL